MKKGDSDLLKDTSKTLFYHTARRMVISLSMGLVLMFLLPAVAFGASSGIDVIDPDNPNISAVIDTTSVTVQEIQDGKAIIKVTLDNGKWTLTTTQINNLINGLTVTPDNASWSLVRTALKRGNSTNSATGTGNNYFSVSDENNDAYKETLTIALPAVPDYSPITDQTLTLTIPKSLLPSSHQNNVIEATRDLCLPDFNEMVNLANALQGEEFSNAFGDNVLNEIYLRVPIKYLKSVTNKQAKFSSDEKGVYVNSLIVYTDNAVDEVQVTVDGIEYTRNVFVEDAKGIRSFNVGFTTSEELYDTKIILLDEGGSILTEENVKMAGTKSNYTPKTTNLSGTYSMYKLVNNPTLLAKILDDYTLDDIDLCTVH